MGRGGWGGMNRPQGHMSVGYSLLNLKLRSPGSLYAQSLKSLTYTTNESILGGMWTHFVLVIIKYLFVFRILDS